jgi:hypothetical protein
MSEKVIFQVTSANVSGMITEICSLINRGLFKGVVEVILQRPARTLSQNRKMWPMLTDVSKQVNWYGEKLDNEDWKDVCMSSLNKQRAVPGIDGGFVGLSKRTSKLDKEGFAQLIEVIYAFGSEQNVAWSEPALQTYSKYREAA